jgi:undecaprenyl-diphosphatase
MKAVQPLPVGSAPATPRTRRLVRLAVAALVLGLAVVFPALPARAAEVVDEAAAGLSLWKALVLGLVEGITEFLPISSTGHLLVANRLLGLDDTEASERAIETYTICIQAGAILAVVFLYWDRVLEMAAGLLGRNEMGRRILAAVIAAFVPTALIGLTLADTVKEQLFGIVPVALAWLVGGVVIIALDRRDWFARSGRGLGDLAVRQAVIIGFAQAIALWPGVSRSMVTIIAGVAVGLSLGAAVEFSFLLGFVTLSAATGLEGLRNGQELVDTFGWYTPTAGLVMAFVSAVVAVRWMVAWLQRRGFGAFGRYRVVIGIVALVLAATSVL